MPTIGDWFRGVERLLEVSTDLFYSKPDTGLHNDLSNSLTHEIQSITKLDWFSHRWSRFSIHSKGYQTLGLCERALKLLDQMAALCSGRKHHGEVGVRGAPKIVQAPGRGGGG